MAAGAGALSAGLILIPRSRGPLLVGFALLVVAEAALLTSHGSAEVLAALVRSGGGLLALGVALAALLGLAAVLVRYPIAVAPLAVLAAPLRPPVALGGEGFPLQLATSGTLGRLLPLYGVLAAAVLALLWRALRGEALRELPRPLVVPAAVFVSLTILSVLWAIDPAAARDQLAFFWLPFLALFAVLARGPVDERLPRLLALALVVPAAAYAVIGLWQAASGQVFFSSPDLEAANAYGSLFRVTSLFDDPSHYGLHLVLAIAVVLVALWLGRASLWPGIALLALLAAGLWFSYSQSSAVALVAVALALAFVAGTRRTRQLTAVVTTLIALGVTALLAVQLAAGPQRSVTSERSRLVEDTAVVFLNHPVVGVGVAGQPLASRAEAGERGSLRRSVSHTTPLTVASELGAVGLAAYLALLAGAVYVVAVSRTRHPALGLGLAAALLVLFVHSLFYEGFFDNPLTWGLLGIAAAAASGARLSWRRRAPQAAVGAPARAPDDDHHSPPAAPRVRGAPSGG